MIDAAVAAEAGQGMAKDTQTDKADAGSKGQGCPGQEGSEVKMTREGIHGSSGSEGSGGLGRVDGEGLVPPLVWPSFSLKPCADTLQLESQDSGGDGECARSSDDTVHEGITAEENERELQFAIAAMDIPAVPQTMTTAMVAVSWRKWRALRSGE